MSDQTIECKDCRQSFVFTEGEAQFFESRGFTPPKRCKGCRAEKKRQQEEDANRGG